MRWQKCNYILPSIFFHLFFYRQSQNFPYLDPFLFPYFSLLLPLHIHSWAAMSSSIFFHLTISISILISAAAAAVPPLPSPPKSGISCLAVGSTATAYWTNAAGQSCTWTGVVGSNFGKNPVNGGEYVIASHHFTLPAWSFKKGSTWR